MRLVLPLFSLCLEQKFTWVELLRSVEYPNILLRGTSAVIIVILSAVSSLDEITPFRLFSSPITLPLKLINRYLIGFKREGRREEEREKRTWNSEGT